MRHIASILAVLGAAFTGSSQVHAQSIGHVDRFLDRMAAYGYGGAIGVAVDDSVLLERGYGLADRGRDIPVDAETRFDVGSLTKPFVAALVLRLAEDGKVSVADSLGGRLPDVPPDKAGITIHQLLTHTSGLVRSAASLGVEPATARDEFVAAVMGAELLWPPGDRFEYSDTGYDLLAAIAERVTGRPFDLLLDSLVLDPAGARHTGYADAPGLPAAAPSYTSSFGVPWADGREGPSTPTWFNRGSGGLVSTVGDLLRFEQALRDGDILSQASLAEMWKPWAPVDGTRFYGYCWFVDETSRGPAIYHGGDIAGYKAHLARYPERRVTFAVLHNVLGWERVTDRDAIAAWFGEPLDLPPESQSLAGTELGRVEGTYRTPRGDPLVVWTEAGRLAVEAEGQANVDVLFGSTGPETAERTTDARQVLDALAAADTAAIAARMRDRDREQGRAANFLGYWDLLRRRDGEVVDTRVLGSQPAQDGTVVSVIEIRRTAGQDTTREIFRLVWRGDRLVTAGGDAGLRRPTAVLAPTGRHDAARYAVDSRATTTLAIDGERLRLESAGRTLTAARDTVTPIDPPARSIVRALLPTFHREGPEAGLAALDRLRDREASRYDVGEFAVNDLGYGLLHGGAIDAAIAVFERNVADHPDSWNAHDSLGEAYLVAGRLAEARRSYARSLELNPENETAREIVNRRDEE